MADVLSQSQIDELLNSFSSEGSKALDKIEDESHKDDLKVYDFKTPKKFTKEKLKTTEGIFESYARLLSSYLTGLMRLYCNVEILQIEEQKYYEYNNALPDYVMMGIVNVHVPADDMLDTSIIYQVSNPITYTMMDRMLGGHGSYVDMNRDFTEIEISLMKGIIEKMVSPLTEAFSNYIDIDTDMERLETNSRVVQNIGIDDVIILVTLQIEIKDVKNTVSICFPAINLEEMMKKFSDKYRNTKRFDATKDGERREEILDKIKNSPLEVTAVLAETQIDLFDILTLQVNDVIPLNKKIEDNVTVKVGNNLWFDGKLGVKNNKKAIMIDNIYKN